MSDKLLFPGISNVAAVKLAEIGGSFLHMDHEEQKELTDSLRASRSRGSTVKTIGKRKNAKGKDEQEDQGESGPTSSGEGSPQQEGEEGLGNSDGERGKGQS